ncbi:uncharacterized protein LOC122004111 [Zingiber officinale]|uniref:uncharacterized protein LOC122004111 n=1 Tax=Zingiber officinale TaxID=94328 RepID=UPI001C4AAE91|nr:uncharacterized protein LOC122004111 [Zingiber officinale]
MLFYLTTLNLIWFLHEDPPAVTEGNSDSKAACDAWSHGDFLCLNYVLNALYNVHCSIEMAKSLWESLERKYKTESAGLKKFIVGRFLDFKMLDSKSVTSQVQDMQLIMHDLDAEGMKLNESFKVATVIEKLPPLWKDFKNYLKHKQKEMGLEDLILRLRIEEDNRKMLDSRGTKRQSTRCPTWLSQKPKSRSNPKRMLKARNSRAHATIAEIQGTCPRIADARRNQPKVRRMLRTKL